MRWRSWQAALGCLVLVQAHTAWAWPLVTEAEAQLAAAAAAVDGEITAKAVSRGPSIRLIAPAPNALNLTSPLALKIAFEAHGGAKINLASFSMVYLKTPAVDVLPRLKAGLTESGLDLQGVELPVGDHAFKITLKDTEGRQSTAQFTLKITR